MFLINPELTSDSYYLPPKEGDKVKVSGNVYYVNFLDNAGNDAGFGWVWLYNPMTRHYDYKMSIFDKRTIPGTTEIPGVGLSNKDAYLAVSKTYINNFGFELTFKRIFNELLSFFR